MTDLLSLQRMARRLGVTQHWLRAQADAGRVPVLRAGNRYLFAAAAVEAALAALAGQTDQPGDNSQEVTQ